MRVLMIVGLGIALLSLSSEEAIAARPKVKLFQVGSNGNYCLSTTKDTSGCVSGVNDKGDLINHLDVFRGYDLEFYNVSDAFHDMDIKGKNQEKFPAQGPNAAAVAKNMSVTDMEKQKISCTFHGDQLGLGYRVPEIQGGDLTGHKERIRGGSLGGSSPMASTLPGGGPPGQPMRRTGLADVSDQILAKGRPLEVQKLISARPELAAKLEAIRPLLAAELGISAPRTLASGGSAGDGIFASPSAAKDKGGAAGGSGGKAQNVLAATGGTLEDGPVGGKETAQKGSTLAAGQKNKGSLAGQALAQANRAEDSLVVAPTFHGQVTITGLGGKIRDTSSSSAGVRGVMSNEYGDPIHLKSVRDLSRPNPALIWLKKSRWFFGFLGVGLLWWLVLFRRRKQQKKLPIWVAKG